MYIKSHLHKLKMINKQHTPSAIEKKGGGEELWSAKIVNHLKVSQQYSKINLTSIFTPFGPCPDHDSHQLRFTTCLETLSPVEDS